MSDPLKRGAKESDPSEDAADENALAEGAGPYRGGDALHRLVALERRAIDAEARVAEIESAWWAARKAVRLRKASRALVVGGYGSLLGSIVGAILYGADGNPYFILAATILGVLFGALVGAMWDPPDDHFPAAPPPRFR